MDTTYQPKAKDIERSWHILSAKGNVLGRLATEATRLLMGKHKKTYVPHLDMGDYVVITDSKEVVLTGKKEEQKIYKKYSGYPSGLKQTKAVVVRATRPERLIEHAILGMLPDNRLKKARRGRLKVFAGPEHPYKEKLKTEN